MQPLAQEPLLPTPANVNTIHLPHDELLSFVSVQHWLQQHLGGALAQLLGGSFVLVQSTDLPPPVKPQDAQAAASIPWRLRQVAAVELGPPGSDPAGSTVVLVGGDRVSAGSVGGPLESAPDYQYLCCELAALQEARLMSPLKVYDVAHVAWRMRTCAELEAAIAAYSQEQAELVAAGYDTEMLQQAGQVTRDLVQGTLRRLPALDWVSGQIMQYIELNPYAWPESPEQPWQLLSAGQYSQLIQAAAAAWGQYVACIATGQQPQPVLELVPWAALDSADSTNVSCTLQHPAAPAATRNTQCDEPSLQSSEEGETPEPSAPHSRTPSGGTAPAAQRHAVESTAQQPAHLARGDRRSANASEASRGGDRHRHQTPTRARSRSRSWSPNRRCSSHRRSRSRSWSPHRQHSSRSRSRSYSVRAEGPASGMRQDRHKQQHHYSSGQQRRGGSSGPSQPFPPTPPAAWEAPQARGSRQRGALYEWELSLLRALDAQPAPRRLSLSAARNLLPQPLADLLARRQAWGRGWWLSAAARAGPQGPQNSMPLLEARAV